MIAFVLRVKILMDINNEIVKKHWGFTLIWLVPEAEKQQITGNVRAIYQTARWHMAKDRKHDKSSEKFYLGFQKLLNSYMICLCNFYQTALDFVPIANSELAK